MQGLAAQGVSGFDPVDSNVDFGDALKRALLATVGFTDTDELAPGFSGFFKRRRVAEDRLRVRLTFYGSDDGTDDNTMDVLTVADTLGWFERSRRANGFGTRRDPSRVAR
jgi:hypothetical protein